MTRDNERNKNMKFFLSIAKAANHNAIPVQNMKHSYGIKLTFHVKSDPINS